MLISVLVLASLLVSEAQGRCPSQTSISPCKCTTMKDNGGVNFSTLTCEGLTSADTLMGALYATRGFPMFELEILHSSLRFLPHDAFHETTYEVISVKHSGLHSLSDTEKAFEGLEDQLHLIEIMNCSYTADWDWEQLSHLRHLLEIIVVDSELIDVTDSLSSVQHIDVENFSFQRNGIKVLADNAFSRFSNLQRLQLDQNEIEEIKRSMFPNPSKSLQSLGLSYNKIGQLPIDAFQNMPQLQSLYLAGNPLTTIDELVFKPIWNQLRMFLFFATQLSCDCRISWLVKMDNSKKYMHAECQYPGQYKGQLLETLKPHELTC